MKFGHTIEESQRRYPEITDELLKSLQKWADDQDLPKIPKEQLALFAHSCYFDLASTKQCMDAYYRMRSTIPEFFNDRDPKREYLQRSLKVLDFIPLPKPDRNGSRIIFHRLADSRPSQYMFNDGIKLLLMSTEASLYTEGCSPGYIFLFDMENDAMPVRLKAIHVLNAVWFMDKILALIRPFMKRELYEMLHVHTGDVSDIYSHIPLECLPKDYNGELDYVANLHKEHCMKLDQLRDYFLEEETLFRNYSPKEKIASN
ncbi:alpha-tocopherol transfer protein-like isoform X2 [Anoplolepis gracilipes]|uniref:alpha-tocopherol transfer protein-like isoform X2 n=1 Tax=Anoplolepis gracilipes TaxID=354296 RepID=UPI003B9E716A